MSHTDSQLFTPEQVNSQCNAMWDAYARCIELDDVVDMDKLVDYIDMYLTTHGDDVSVRVMEDYLNARYATMQSGVVDGVLMQFCVH